MKCLVKALFIFAMIFGSVNIVCAQTSRKEKRAAKAAILKGKIDTGHYTFTANYAIPQRGGTKVLTSDYDLRVVKDSVIAYLPYYGRAYMAPNDPGTNEGGIKFTSTNFTYNKKVLKNGNWEIYIKPKDKNTNDWRDVQELTLSISADGYASLQVLSKHREPISFNGTVE